MHHLEIDKSVTAGYEDVRNDKTKTNWIVLGYENRDYSKLKMMSYGEGGLAEFVTHLDPSIACYGFIRMVVGNDDLVCFI